MGSATMVVYAYIPIPTSDQISTFLEQLCKSGMMISRLGKNDPPKRWAGTPAEAADFIRSGDNGTNYTFLEAANWLLSMTVVMRQDTRWGYSTLSFDGAEPLRVDTVSRIVLETLSPYLCIQGMAGRGKDQAWEVLHRSTDCPESLRSLVQA
jgi:hypothetical protein